MDNRQEVLTLKEASSILRVCPKTLAKIIKKGKIIAKRTCRAKNAPYRILKESIITFLNE